MLLLAGAGLTALGLITKPTSATTERGKITFSGLQRTSGGGAIVFVHLDRKVETSIAREGTQFHLRFMNATIGVPNNAHALDLRHFDLLISRSQLVAVQGDVELQIELRKPAALDTRENGQVSLHVIIPPP